MSSSKSPALPFTDASPRVRRPSASSIPVEPLSNARGAKPLGAGGKLVATGRFRLRHLVLILVVISTTLFLLTGDSSKAKSRRKHDAMSFCPHSTARRHIPTVILQGDGASERTANRTYWVGGAYPANFLPYSYPPREMRFAQTILDAPPPPHKPGAGHLRDTAHDKEEVSKQVCKVHSVPSSPPPMVPKTWHNNRIMFGMSTTADRTLYQLPVWSHWFPSSKHRIDIALHASAAAEVPEIFILTPPPNPTESARMTEAVEEAHGLGINVVMRKREADRFERRYFLLAEEMWLEAEKRKTDHDVDTEWFVFCDDDTFFPDWDSVIRMLSEYDSSKPVLLGALSESVKQVSQWGHISYGGAGIFVSRAMLKLFNKPGQIDECLEKFGAAFGGDAMVAHCAALVTKKDINEVLVIDDTLHQLDIRGDGTGFFQSGFRFTSLHHWGSWFTVFPNWSESGSGDLRKGITLIGKAAKAVGGDNWGRRYVFEDGKVVVSLGYSVSVEAKALSESELNKSEHTWWEFETFHPIRPGKPESVEKRTYYITAVRHLERDVVKLEHKNREGERVDIIWDARAQPTNLKWTVSKFKNSR